MSFTILKNNSGRIIKKTLNDNNSIGLNNNESLDVTLSYVTVASSNNTGMLFDSVNINYDDICVYMNINKSINKSYTFLSVPQVWVPVKINLISSSVMPNSFSGIMGFFFKKLNI